MKETRKRHLHVDYLQAANGQKWPIVYNSSTIQIAVFVKLYDVKRLVVSSGCCYRCCSVVVVVIMLQRTRSPPSIVVNHRRRSRERGGKGGLQSPLATEIM